MAVEMCGLTTDSTVFWKASASWLPEGDIRNTALSTNWGMTGGLICFTTTESSLGIIKTCFTPLGDL